jgi:hypothetical protein
MSEPVTVAIPLEGYDAESRAISAMIRLLEDVNFGSLDPTGTLSPTSKARIVGYLMDRYGSPPGKSRNEGETQA